MGEICELPQKLGLSDRHGALTFFYEKMLALLLKLHLFHV